jgi:hypothetical protein
MRAICDGDQSRTTAADLEDSNMRARARSGIFERKKYLALRRVQGSSQR